MSLAELEGAVKDLSKDELAKFSKWFDDFLADEWDKQIERDVEAGRFEEAGQRAIEDFKAGRCTPL